MDGSILKMIESSVSSNIGSFRKQLRKKHLLNGLRKIYSDTRLDLIGHQLKQRNHSKLAIIGCGRSGTKYVSELFNSLGINIGHERLGKHGIASWTLVPDTSIELWGPSFKKIKSFKLPLVHQVREPIKVISSVRTVFSDSKTWEFISKFIPINDNDSIIIKSMKYWYHWNLMSEKMAIYTYKVEEIEETISELFKIGRFEAAISKRSFLPSISKRANSRAHSNLTWDNLKKADLNLSQKIYDLSIHYGYKY